MLSTICELRNQVLHLFIQLFECSDSVVFFVFILYFGTVPTVWYFFCFYISFFYAVEITAFTVNTLQFIHTFWVVFMITCVNLAKNYLVHDLKQYVISTTFNNISGMACRGELFVSWIY